MHLAMLPTLVKLASLASIFTTVRGQTAYANDFVDPDYILSKDFGASTYGARSSIISWAGTLAASGPWSVMNKSVTPPSGDKHDYMSWAPYWWPDCSSVGNTTALAPEQVWTTCPYKSRDGQFNPDGRLVNDVGAFQDMSEAVFYNTLAWVVSNSTNKDDFAANAVKFIRTWFLDEATRMNPDLAYGQMQRGPDGQMGSHTGVLDLKAMAKVASAVLILRKGQSTAWTSDLDGQLVSWSQKYATWLETADIAIEEALSSNNHGSFYYNQLAALKILVNDLPGAKNVTDTYFNTLYMAQIVGSGEQPLEAARTRPYHYRAYNLAAMITNARLAKYAAPTSDPWHKPTNEGTNIKSALDFAMTISAATSGETSYAGELYPNIAAVAAVYGDADGKYLSFLKQAYPAFIREPYILWNQPFAQNESSGFAPAGAATKATTSGTTKATGSASKNASQSANAAASNKRNALLSTLALSSAILIISWVAS